MAFANNPRGQQAVEVSGAFTGIAVVTVLLRLYTRIFMVRCAGVEDYCITVAMLCSIGLTVCIGIQAKYGMGQHIADLEPDEMQHSLKAFWASLIVYYLSLGLTKTSILLQYRRVFSTPKFRIACYTVLAVVIIYTIWTEFGSIFACLPVRAFWTKEQPSKCINQFSMWFTNAGINILTDFAIIILPIPVIQSLNLARRQKQALIGIFAIGGFVCIVSILRLHSLVAISNSTDPTYDNPPAATWSSIETNVGIICSCLPCLRPLFARFLPGLLSSASPYQYGANSRRSRLSRNLFSQKSHVQGGAIPLESKLSGNSSNKSSHHDEKDARIQVVTEVHVSVEEGRSNERHAQSDNKNSTDSLVRDLAEVV